MTIKCLKLGEEDGAKNFAAIFPPVTSEIVGSLAGPREFQ